MARGFAAFLIAALAALSFPAAAEPRSWRVDEAASTLAIVYLINGEERRGGFSRFSGEAVFDPEDLSTAELTFVIETASFDAGDVFGTEVVRGVDWLSVVAHPQARYVLTALEPLGGDRYLATGDLTMRGTTGEIVGEMTLAIAEETVRATGGAEFNRRDYRVGVGFTTLFVDVGAEIAVAFDLIAIPKE